MMSLETLWTEILPMTMTEILPITYNSITTSMDVSGKSTASKLGNYKS